MKEPTRLSLEGGHLAGALEGLRRRAPDHERLSRMAQALAAQGVEVHVAPVGEPPPEPSAGREVTREAGRSLAVKVGAGVGGALAVGLAAWLLAGSPPPLQAPTPSFQAARGVVPPAGGNALQSPARELSSAARPQDRSAEPSAPAAEGSAPGEEAPATSSGSPPRVGGEGGPRSAGTQPSVSPSPRPAVHTPASRPKEVPASKGQQAAPPLGAATGESEISLLKRAREALAANPGTALSLAEQHREQFHPGRLAQEREVIAITALVRLGRPTSAEKRADQFMRTYPGSAYAGQIRRIVGEP